MLCALLLVSLTGTLRISQDSPAQALPKGAVVLFSGKQEDLDEKWHRRPGMPVLWKLKDGSLVAGGGGDIMTKEKYTDFQLHIEFKLADMPQKKGQSKSNSGVKLQGRYEIQILDSYGNANPGTGDCGALYTIAAPLVNATKPPLQWQTYDISFRAPRYDSEGKMTLPGSVTVIHNGIVVQNNTQILRNTSDRTPDPDMKNPGPILLQDHGCPVEFRNIWILPLPLEGAKHY